MRLQVSMLVLYDDCICVCVCGEEFYGERRKVAGKAK